MFNTNYPKWVVGVIKGMPEEGERMEKIAVMLDDMAIMPERAHPEDAGLDLRTPVDFTVHEADRISIDTGVHILIPKGYVGFLKSKSGLNVNYGIRTEGVIDAGYTGSIVVCVYNDGDYPRHFRAGDKISQLVILPVETPEPQLVESFPETERGNNGFGSTGE